MLVNEMSKQQAHAPKAFQVLAGLLSHVTATPGPGNSVTASPPRLFLPAHVATLRQAEPPGFGSLLAALPWPVPTSPIPPPPLVMH